MVTEALIGMFAGIVAGLLSLLPAWSMDLGSLTNQGSTIGGYASSMNGYFPIATLGVCLALVMGTKVLLSAWGFIVRVYELIPFKMT